MSEHSTGPWTVDGRYDVIDANGDYVASPDLVWHSNAEAEANARLMAAAPSLYDALDAFLSITSYCGKEHCTSVHCVAAHNAIKALAAARGES